MDLSDNVRRRNSLRMRLRFLCRTCRRWFMCTEFNFITAKYIRFCEWICAPWCRQLIQYFPPVCFPIMHLSVRNTGIKIKSQWEESFDSKIFSCLTSLPPLHTMKNYTQWLICHTAHRQRAWRLVYLLIISHSFFIFADAKSLQHQPLSHPFH